MTRGSFRSVALALPLAMLVLWAGLPAQGQRTSPRNTGTANGEWHSQGGDLGNTRYSALDQLNAANFGNLEVAWRFKADNLGPRPEFNWQVTPLMVHGVLYLTAGTRRAVVALDAGTGEMLWAHSEHEGVREEATSLRQPGRGLAYWTDGREERIYYVTIGYRLVALNAKTGAPVPTFGKGGIVDLKLDFDQQIDPVTGEVGLHSAPIIANDVVVVGAAHRPGGRPKTKSNVKGFIRGFDVRTGKRLWTFHTIPQSGEVGTNTWEKDSWATNGNAGSWANLTADEELGIVYVSVELPTGDYYGGHRPGAGLFGEILVALDIRTGVRKWHFQLVHHGIWDHDIPSPPIVADITVDGRKIKAIAQPSKQGWLYVFDRATGAPVWPIVERPVEKGAVPGEWYSPTQPFVTKPPAFDQQGISENDLIDFTPALRAEALKAVEKYRMGPLFTPPPLSRWEGPRALIQVPANSGSANWPGGSYDPDTQMFYVYSKTGITTIGLIPADPKVSDMAYYQGQASDPAVARTDRAAGGRAVEGGGSEGGSLTVQGLPLVKPPYGRITAINLNKGDIAWQVAHGETPDNIKNHPALKGVTIPRTGRSGYIGTLVTKTLVIAGEAGVSTTPGGLRGAMLRAYDKTTGKDVGEVYMPAGQTGGPITYMFNGKQYVTVTIGGPGYSGELLTFKLP